MTTKTAPVSSPQTNSTAATVQPAVRTLDLGEALRIGVDGRIDTIDLNPADNGSCGAAIRQAIGCRLYAVTDVNAQIDMWTDDEGVPDLGDVELVGATLNPLATLLLAEHRPIHQPYFGVALFTGVDGERTVGLDAAALTRLRAAAEAIASRPAQVEAFRRRIITAVTRQA